MSEEINHIRPDLRVGRLARLAFSTYFNSVGCDPAEIVHLQDGEYCHNTFVLNRTMPVLVPVSVIEDAPDGSHVGQAGFYATKYWAQVFNVFGVEYRLVNDWKEPSQTQPRDNRTPLEDWIRSKGIVL